MVDLPPSVRITGIGAEIPPDEITTAEVEERLGLRRFGLAPGWLEQVTGVRTRRWATPDVRPSMLAADAARKALANAGMEAADVDMLVFTGITRDCLEPATANLVADALGARGARVFDLVNACNSLVDGIDVAESLIRTGKAERVLVATGERASLAIDWQARTMEEVLESLASLVVGDGGGAVVLERSSDPERGVRAREFRSDAARSSHPVGGPLRREDRACEICGGVLDPGFRCDGRDLFAAALGLLQPAMETVMARTGWSYDDLDIVFCHQPTKRFVEHAAPFLGEASLAVAKLWWTAERYGNTSTASLPLAMTEAAAAGALEPGAKVLVLAPSSGASAAAMTMVW